MQTSGVNFVTSSSAPSGSEIQSSGKAFGSDSLSGYCSSTASGIAPSNGAKRAGVSGIHCWDNLNDNEPGNSNSWILNAASGLVGIQFDAGRTITGFGIARDSTGGYSDRTGGTFYIKVLSAADAAACTTFEQLQSAGGWYTIGSFTRTGAGQQYWSFTEPLVGVGAIALDIVQGAGTCIDEFRIYESAGSCVSSETQPFTH